MLEVQVNDLLARGVGANLIIEMKSLYEAKNQCSVRCACAHTQTFYIRLKTL